MTWYDLVSLTDEEAVYDYYPESRESERGRVSFDRASGSLTVLERPYADRHSSYSNHLAARLREFNASGKFTRNGYVAWC